MSNIQPAGSKSVIREEMRWCLIAAIWTLIICALCTYAIIQSKQGISENATLEAKTNIDKDLAYRRWAAEQGGIYASPTEKTPPNPYLKVPNRDVVTTDGKKLTLINPAYMTRLVQERTAELYGIKGHLTSLNPTRPENMPDAWEESALKQIESGAKEVTQVVDLEGNPYLRHMRAFVTENKCLKCHAEQGYAEGDIRGGISVSVPLDHYYAIYRTDRNGTLLRYSILWIIGISGILALRRSIKLSSASLEASEKRFRTLIDQAPEAIVVFKADNLQIVDANPAAEILFGCGRENLQQSGLLRFYCKDQPDMRSPDESVAENIQRVLSGEIVKTERFIHTADDRIILCELHLVLLPDEHDQLIRGSFLDITARKKSEQELRHSYELMSYIIKYNTSALAVHDKDLKYLFVSDRYLKDYKVEGMDIVGKHHYEVFPDLPQKWRDVHQKALEGIISRAENDRYEREDGSVEWTTWECRPWYEVNGDVGGFALYTEVVTDRIKAEEQRLKLQEQLHQSQKMEAIGQLAGGVAHDFNNILQVIEGYCSLLQIDTSLNEKQKKEIDAIAAASDRATHLTHGLLAFSRKQPLLMKQEDINNIVQHVQKFVARIIGEDITFVTECCGQELPVNADRGQIEQVLVNLATNARDAMPSGGVFTIKTELVNSINTNDVSHDQPKMPGMYVKLSVSDTGNGIAKDHLDHIFEPFFTTKEIGKGTGLGMAIVYGIIKQHNGNITVSSEIGKGTDFRIYLPIIQGRDTPAVANSEDVISPYNGHETILVAEDDPAVRSLITEILATSGYEVILAEDGDDAIKKFKYNQDKISLLLFDLIMPKRNGMSAYQEIQQIMPGIKVIFASGYTADFMKDRGVSDEEIEIIMKPVKPSELLKKVREILNS